MQKSADNIGDDKGGISIKKLSLLVVLVITLALASIEVTGATNPSITADPVETLAGQTVSIPVCITNNHGIMGFKISVEYPDETLINPTVKRGEVTAHGMMDDTIMDSTRGAFSIVWSNAEDVKIDDTIFILGFSVAPDAHDRDVDIKLTYSQPDTFNEQWEDVILNMSYIKVHIGGNSSSSQETGEIRTTITDTTVNQSIKTTATGMMSSTQSVLIGSGTVTTEVSVDTENQNKVTTILDELVTTTVGTTTVGTTTRPAKTEVIGQNETYRTCMLWWFVLIAIIAISTILVSIALYTKRKTKEDDSI